MNSQIMNRINLITLCCAFSMFFIDSGTAQVRDSLRQLLNTHHAADLQRAVVLYQYGKLIRGDSLPVSSRYLQEGLDISKVIGNDTLTVDLFQALGVSYGMQSMYPESIGNFQEAVKKAREIGDDERIATSLNGLGIVHKRLGDYPASQQYYYQALEIYEKTGDEQGHAVAMENLGILYDLMGEVEKSASCYQQALLYYTAHNLPILEAGVKSNLAILLLKQARYDSAMHILKDALKIYQENGRHHNVVNMITNIGNIHNRLGQYDSAIYVSEPALAHAKALNLKQEQVNLSYNLADACIGLSNWKQALNYAREQSRVASETGSFSLMRDAEKMLSKVYEHAGDATAALSHFKKSVQWSDSLINEEKARTFKIQEVKMEVMKKDVQLAEQAKTLLVQDQKIALEKRWRFLLIASIFLVSLAAFMVYQRYLSRQRYARLLEEKNRLISTQKEKIEQAKTELEGRMLRSQLNPHFIFNSLSSIQHFITENDKVNALRYLSKFSILLRKVLDSSFSLNNAMDEEIKLLKVYLDLESLRFNGTFSYKIDIEHDLDPQSYEMPTLLLQPFIENALLHGLLPKDGRKNLQVSFRANAQMIHCTVEDNGIGRQASGILNEKKSRHGLARGISVSRQRIAILSRQYHVPAGVFYEDILDEEGNIAGTRVHIDLPKIEAN